MVPVERILYRPTEAAEAIGVSRSRFYELLAAREIPSITVRGVKRVPVAALREWVNRQLVADGHAPVATGADGDGAA